MVNEFRMISVWWIQINNSCTWLVAESELNFRLATDDDDDDDFKKFFVVLNDQ